MRNTFAGGVFIAVASVFLGMTGWSPAAIAATPIDDESGASAQSPPSVAAEPAEGGPCYDQTTGTDLVVRSISSVGQFGREGEIGSGKVGISVFTRSFNTGTTNLHWDRLPAASHPLIAQHLYRMRDVDGSTRFEQIGVSWIKHGFSTIQNGICPGVIPNDGCLTGPDNQTLGVGCTDPYTLSTNAIQCGVGPRNIFHPFKGTFPLGPDTGFDVCGMNFPSSNHADHVHDGISHRLQVRDEDLDPTANAGARYFAEGQYFMAQEFEEAAMNNFEALFNNISYTEVTVTGPDANGKFSFFTTTLPATTIREQPALNAWTSATQTIVEPDPGNDGRAIVAYEVTDLGDGTWHYEYALYNQNLDDAVGYFEVPLAPGVTVTNAGFHAPDQHGPELHADTMSNEPWNIAELTDAVVFSTDDIATDPLANAVRYGTLYNVRFDADSPPMQVNAVMGLFKSGGSVEVATLGPSPVGPPEIVHGQSGVSFDEHAFSGYVDPRRESTDGESLDAGLTEFVVHFNMPVRAVDGGPVHAGSFLVRETGMADPPAIADVSVLDPQTARITLSRPITLREWTTLEADVENEMGEPIENLGDLGPGIDEPDRIDVAFLPCDTDGNGAVQPNDLIRFRQFAAGSALPARGLPTDYDDTDRNGVFQPVDLIAFRQGLAGTGNATLVWLTLSLNHPRP